MPYICSKCGENITKEYAEKTTEKFRDAYCSKCAFDMIENQKESTDETVNDQSFGVKGQQDTCEVLGARGTIMKTIKDAESAPSAPHEERAYPTYAIVEDGDKNTACRFPALDIATIKEYICPNATDQEAFMFLRLCQSRNLNPFVKEAYLIKYSKTATATMVVGKDAFTSRAETNKNFDGFEAGIIVNSGEEGKFDIIDERVGTFMHEGEKLLGGWATVHRKDHKYPITVKVSMTEYTQKSNQTGQPNAQWTKMPATMIRKVALVQSLRESFPSDLGGCYDSSEMGMEI